MIRLYAALVGVAALLGALTWWSAHERDVGAEDVRNEVREAAAASQKRNNELAADLEAEKARKKVIYARITQTIDKIVDRPVYVRECLDDDGLRLVNAALAGRAASQSDDAVPAADATDGDDGR